MKNVTELRDDLLDVYKQMKAGEIDKPLGGELANISGKIIKSAATQLAYNQFMKYDKNVIKFLEGE